MHIGRELLAVELALEDVQQVYRIRCHFGMVVVENAREHLECVARGQTGHAFVDTCVFTIFLQRLGLGIDVLQVLTIVHTHLRFDGTVLRRRQA